MDKKKPRLVCICEEKSTGAIEFLNRVRGRRGRRKLEEVEGQLIILDRGGEC